MRKEDFFSRVSPEPISGCWLWTGRITDSGYGTLSVKSVKHFAHRLSYQLFVGPIMRGLEVMHTCHNRSCCNPQHLQVGTHAENMRQAKERGSMKKLHTHCREGHELNEENLLTMSSGERRCRVCHRRKALMYHRIKMGMAVDAPVKKYRKRLDQISTKSRNCR